MKDFTIAGVHEWLAHDPFGRMKPGDSGAATPSICDEHGDVHLVTPKNGYVSFRALVSGDGEYAIAVVNQSDLEVDVFRAWYHGIARGDGKVGYAPDALVPVGGSGDFRLPDDDNEIPGQTAQEFWIDVFASDDIDLGRHEFTIELSSGGTTQQLRVTIEVSPACIPGMSSIMVDHNSYGSLWLDAYYPSILGDGLSESQHTNEIIGLLHNYYRLVREHRGVFHNLGTSHSGSVNSLYAPGKQGRGRDLEITDWQTYDTHFGPLFDGSAFETAAPGGARSRRPAFPLETVYTPFTPSWPASYEKWGEEGYAVELSRGLKQFDRHLQDNGWINTNLEFFFNHKKRYRWYAWDGDEVKESKDHVYHDEMMRIFEGATANSAAPWVYRFDASWQAGPQMRRYAGRKNFWVTGGMHRWYRAQVEEALDRNEIVWWYGGLPPIQAPSTAIQGSIYETWARNLQGFCLWLVSKPDADPWYRCEGNATGSLYPGEKFGIKGPIPSIRLKIQRNAVQDLDLLAGIIKERPGVAADIQNAIPIEPWREPPKAARILDPGAWDSDNLQSEHEPRYLATDQENPFWWQAIRKKIRERDHV